MVELRNIKKDYYLSKTNVVKVLKGIDLKFRENEFVTILGPSGCGKTTLLNIIGGLDVSDDGEILINGISTKEYSSSDWDNYRNKSIGFVFQSYNLIPHINVIGNVSMPLILKGEKKAVCQKRAIEALKRVGLEEQIHKKPLQLSGGQMQRVAIARALVTDPDIILADEPTGALDNESSVQVMDLLKEVSREKLVIMVTHNDQLAEQYSTRIINLAGGVVAGDSNPYGNEEEAVKDEAIEETEEIVTKESEEIKSEAASESGAEIVEETAKPVEEVKPKANNNTPKAKKERKKKAHLSFGMACSLSAKTLVSKKVRTALTSFAGSIGIIGIILVLAFSSGVNAYITNLERSALSIYPLTIEESNFNVTTLVESFLAGTEEGKEEFPKTEDIYVNKILGNVVGDLLSSMSAKKNDLAQFKTYMTENFDNNLGYVKYNYGLKLNVYAQDPLTPEKYMKVEPFDEVMNNAFGKTGMTMPESVMTTLETYAEQISAWSEMINNQELLNLQYDIIGNGSWPRNEVYEENGKKYADVVMVVDNTNSLNDYELLLVGLKSEDELKAALNPNSDFAKTVYKVSDIVGMEYKVLTGCDYFDKDENDNWIHTETTVQDAEFIDENVAVTARISAVVRPKKGAAGTSINTKIGYTEALTQYLIDYTNNSEIATAQRQQYEEDQTSVISKRPITKSAYESFMTDKVGIADFSKPMSVMIYANTFEAKLKIKEFIKEYNEETGSEIEASDGLQTLISFVNTMSDTIAKVLIGFCAISLIVSSIMIAVIIYTSVLERRKEVGILRSIGARKRDIVMIFMSESGILGLLSGLIGVFVGWILTLPTNVLLESAVGIANLAIVEWWHVVAMVLVSFGLSIVAGVIPAFIGAKQDPAVALRTE